MLCLHSGDICTLEPVCASRINTNIRVIELSASDLNDSLLCCGLDPPERFLTFHLNISMCVMVSKKSVTPPAVGKHQKANLKKANKKKQRKLNREALYFSDW